MCICINCVHVHTCITYALIKKQHVKFVDNKIKNFMPNDTIIEINIKSSKDRINFDWDLKECSSFTEKPGYWLTL
uniref:hypothetical protein n=1 Tax=Polyopes affinis TaxID=194519 RepID=UPI002A7EE1C8|nr:hypothetical protein NDC12_pgp199 [Polyopes affinis]WOL36937.1 hypothetical protein [Polyopes affinis]